MARTSSVGSRYSALARVMMCALVGIGTPARATPDNPVTPAVSDSVSTAQPAGAVRALQAAYRTRDLERFGALLTDEYRFHAYDETGRYWDMTGFDRDFELVSARCLFGSDPPDTSCPKGMPPAKALDLQMKGLRLAEDPEHPDSTDQFAIVVAEQFRVVIDLPDDRRLETSPGQHVFHVVRGDAARLSHGQIADAQHWYLRRWIAYTDAPGPTGPGAPSPPSAAAPGVLAVRPVANPSGRDLEVWYSLASAEPAELMVFDVQGRRCATRTLRGQDAGPHRIAMGTGARLQPGIYWVRLAQTGQRAVAQMVAVR